jgi:DNA-binding transcriptional LysR family regulator
LSLVAAGCGVALLPEPLSALPHANVIFRPPTVAVSADLFLAFRKDFNSAVRNSLVSALEEEK